MRESRERTSGSQSNCSAVRNSRLDSQSTRCSCARRAVLNICGPAYFHTTYASSLGSRVQRNVLVPARDCNCPGVMTSLKCSLKGRACIHILYRKERFATHSTHSTHSTHAAFRKRRTRSMLDLQASRRNSSLSGFVHRPQRARCCRYISSCFS